ncbi:MAG: glutamate-1-semialdehyde 2,1-aminomutase [Thermoplasmata archaeon]
MSPGAPGRRSRALFVRAGRSLVGGVDSPVRSFAAVGGSPVFFRRGRGAYLTDVDGRRYLDLVNSWGANLLGSAPPSVLRAVRAAAAEGLSFGAPSPREHDLAERIRARVPEMGLLRFVSSGTEATMSAVRLARGVTGRSRIVKFAGGYHGHSDGLLARAGSGVAAQGLPDSAGVPAPVVRSTLVRPYNDPEALERTFERFGPEIAAVIVEPVAANMGVVLPRPGFLEAIGRLTRRFGALAIADEVLTGFRLRPGICAPGLGLAPDLVTLGKIIGGGMPVGAYGGRAELLHSVAPLGPVYQAGTLAGNPVTMAAGAATLRALRPALYDRLERRGARLEELLRGAAESARTGPFHVVRVGSLLGLFFRDPPVPDYAAALGTDRARYARFFHAALDRGIYLPPSPLEALFLSTALTEEDIDRSRPGFEAAFRAARGAAG